MSRALARSERIAGDAYYTPDALAAALVAVLPLRPEDVVWEPHAGGGAFVRALRATGVRVVASAINPAAPGLRAGADATRVADFLGGPSWVAAPTWIVGNPPFGDAEAHVRRALDLAPNVAFLLRLGFLESAGRIPLWRDHPPAVVHVLAERPSFTGGGTDSAAYGLFVWGADRDTRLRWLTWKP